MESIDTSTFKDIPHFSGYMATPDGRVYSKKGFFLKQGTFPTSKGYYKTVSAISDAVGVKGDIVVHRLIALAFHYPGENWVNLQVNHKDGNKINNNEDNLEWLTKEENLRHAYKTGLRNDFMQFKVYDGDNEEPIVCKSLYELRDLLGVSLDNCRSYVVIQANLTRRLFNRWKVEMDASHEDTINREKQATKVVCYNCSTGEHHVTKRAFEASLITNVQPGTLLFNMNKSVRRSMINGWYFYKLEEWEKGVEVPKETEESINKSKERYSRLSMTNLEMMEKSTISGLYIDE